MANRTFLVTGGNGFIGRQIIKRFLSLECDICLLSQEKFLDETKRLTRNLESQRRSRASFEVLVGDITKPDLGLDPEVAARFKNQITDAIHLAAAYDLSLDPKVGNAINVEGTRNVVNFLKPCDRLERFGYMSTTAISGDYEHLYRESDYDVNQTFNNDYERTKFEAEGIVRDAMEQVPTVIFRPTTVVGDSQTGEIDKIDGPYYLIQTIDRNLHLVVPKTGDSLFHIEPVDFVADAFHTIYEKDDAPGNCYHLADPDPPSYQEFIKMVCEYWDKTKPLVTVPPWMMKPFFQLPGAEILFGLPEEAFKYSYLERQYATDGMEEILRHTDVSCPEVEDYLPNILDYYREHLAQGKVKDTRW